MINKVIYKLKNIISELFPMHRQRTHRPRSFSELIDIDFFDGVIFPFLHLIAIFYYLTFQHLREKHLMDMNPVQLLLEGLINDNLIDFGFGFLACFLMVNWCRVLYLEFAGKRVRRRIRDDDSPRRRSPRLKLKHKEQFFVEQITTEEFDQ